jgi:predicted AAA+ superfamily ATPase
MANDHLRIASVRLNSFRAVPNELTLHFSDAEGQKASSCLLLGDNDMGKSSIVDAIEFALQAREVRLRGVIQTRSAVSAAR